MWQVPPENPTGFNGPTFSLTSNLDSLLTKIHATDAVYTENALSFMTPPNYGKLPALKQRGAKLMVYHGTSDPIFSSDDSVDWYQKRCAPPTAGDAANFARLYLVPGMNHCSGGPATDQFDMLSAAGELGRARAGARTRASPPRAVPAMPAASMPTCRRAGRANRSRPLCPYPQVARYKGRGSLEDAASFSCR